MIQPAQDSPLQESGDDEPELVPPKSNQRNLVVLLILLMMTAAVSITIVTVELGLIALATVLGISALLIKDQIALRGGLCSATTKPNSDKRHPVRSPHSDTREPLPFRQRLADYLHVPESKVLRPRPLPVSAMPFWSAVPLAQRPVVLKSVDFIRTILARIRATVRG